MPPFTTASTKSTAFLQCCVSYHQKLSSRLKPQLAHKVHQLSTSLAPPPRNLCKNIPAWLICFTSPTFLSPPSLTNAKSWPQPRATFSTSAWLTTHLFSTPPNRNVIYHLNSSLPHISEESTSIQTCPGTSHLSPMRASSSSVQTTVCMKPTQKSHCEHWLDCGGDCCSLQS